MVIRTGVGKSGVGLSHPTPLGWAHCLRLTNCLWFSSRFLLGLVPLKPLEQALGFQGLLCHQQSSVTTVPLFIQHP